MSCGVGRRHSSDPVWLWLWRRPAATAPIGPLAWEPLYAAGAALEMAKRQKDKKKKKKKSKEQFSGATERNHAIHLNPHSCHHVIPLCHEISIISFTNLKSNEYTLNFLIQYKANGPLRLNSP